MQLKLIKQFLTINFNFKLSFAAGSFETFYKQIFFNNNLKLKKTKIYLKNKKNMLQ